MAETPTTRPSRLAWVTGPLKGLLVLLVLGILLLNLLGLPDWLVSDIVRYVNTGPLSVEARLARYDFPLGIRLSDARLYRKRVVGPPAAEAGSIVMKLSPFGFLSGHSWVRELDIERGIIRPAFLSTGQPANPEKQGSADMEIRLRVHLDDCEIYAVHARRLDCELEADGPSLRFGSIEATLEREGASGDMRGDITYHAGARLLSGHVVTEMDPHIILPILEAWELPATMDVVNWFTFKDAPPRIDMEFKRDFSPNSTFFMKGRLFMENGTYEGVDFLRGDATLTVDWSTNALVILDPVLIVRPEGVGRIRLAIDPDHGVIAFDGDSNLDPKAVARMAGGLSEDFLAQFRFPKGASLKARGFVDWRDYTQTSFKISLDAEDMGLRGFVSDSASFDVRVQGYTNRVENIRAKLYDGSLTASGIFVLDAPPGTGLWYQVKGEARDIDCRQVLPVLMSSFRMEDERGRMRLDLDVSGRAEDPASTTGFGSLRIREVKIFALPIFGELTSLLTRIIPGLDFMLRQSDVDAEFVVRDGRIHANPVTIEGRVLGLSGHGSCSLDQELDFDVQVKLTPDKTLLDKLVRTLTYPISKLLEFKLYGTLAEPHWRPMNLPKEMFERAADAPREGDPSR
jgi:hypothetical protein